LHLTEEDGAAGEADEVVGKNGAVTYGTMNRTADGIR
jgi:hypothetical protein